VSELDARAIDDAGIHFEKSAGVLGRTADFRVSESKKFREGVQVTDPVNRFDPVGTDESDIGCELTRLVPGNQSECDMGEAEKE
jgi:hypothetical protein